MKTIKEIKNMERKGLSLITLKDCFVTNISESVFAYTGCETCDYGSLYGIDYTITFSDGTREFFDVSEMYESPISQGDLMRFILNNLEEFSEMTKFEFMQVLNCQDKILG